MLFLPLQDVEPQNLDSWQSKLQFLSFHLLKIFSSVVFPVSQQRPLGSLTLILAHISALIFLLGFCSIKCGCLSSSLMSLHNLFCGGEINLVSIIVLIKGNTPLHLQIEFWDYISFIHFYLKIPLNVCVYFLKLQYFPL